MARVENHRLTSEFDGLTLSVMTVEPESGAARVTLQLAHGMCEHKERYLPFMEALAAHGCACVINDHRGHGASVRSADDLGYFYAGGAEALISDLHQVGAWFAAKHPGAGRVLFGHSMGSLAVRAFAHRYGTELNVLIVCGSPGYNAASGFGLALAGLIACVRGERYRSGLMKHMALGAYSRRFPAGDSENLWLSARAENVRAYDADPLCGFDFTINGYRALLKLMRMAYLPKKIACPELKLRFCSGADDPCAPDARGFEDAMARMRRAGYRDVCGEMLPGLRHEILNEDGREVLYEKLFHEVIEPLTV